MTPPPRGRGASAFVSSISGCLVALLLLAFWALAGRERILQEAPIPCTPRLKSVSYAPLQEGESPRDFEEGFSVPLPRLARDLSLLADRFSCVRLYASRGNEAIPPLAERLGLQLLLGAWLGGNEEENAREIEVLLSLGRRYGHLIKGLIIGNEVLLRGELAPGQLVAHLRKVKESLPGLPITTADVWPFFLQHPEIADDVDFLMVHILPYWEDGPVAIEDVPGYMEGICGRIVAAFPGKPLCIGEIGWPGEGPMRQGALPSPVNQARFFRTVIPLMDRHGWDYNLLEAFDQPWKRAQEGPAGGTWGIYDAHRKDKGLLDGAVSNHRTWRASALFSVLVFLSLFLPCSLTGSLRTQHPLVLAVVAGLCALSLAEQGTALLLGLASPSEAIASMFLWVLGYAGAWLLLWGLLCVEVSEPMDWEAMERAWKRGTLLQMPLVAFLLEQGILFFLLLFTLALLFDGRYRLFMGPVFLPPVLAVLCLRLRGRARHGIPRHDPLTGLLLTAASLLLLRKEGFSNHQALLWCVLGVTTGVVLLDVFSPRGRRALFTRLRNPRTPLLAGILVATYALADLARTRIMENPSLGTACTDAPLLLLCQVRDFLWQAVQVGLLGYSAPLLLLAGVLFKRRGIAFLAVLLSLQATVLYQPYPGIPTLCLGILWLGTLTAERVPPQPLHRP